MNSEQLWARLAERRPRLRAEVSVHRHRYRGHRWYLLRDASSGRWQRVSEQAWAIVRRLDGQRTLAGILQEVEPGQDTPDNLLSVVNTLHQAELVDWQLPGDAAAQQQRARHLAGRRRLAYLLSPLSTRVPLCDPDAWLDRLSTLATRAFSRATGAALAVLVVAAGLAVGLSWPAVAGYWSLRGLASHAWILVPVTYLVIKTLHEFAHALAVKRWGGEVHEVGIVFLLLMPVPYVDASAAWGFAERYRRMLVGAAGILAEMGIAALGALVFVLVGPGIVKDFAYTAMVLGSLSTLLFNGNPLLRFDGYYVLADALAIPNLGPRASRYWLYLIKRYGFGCADADSPVHARGERRWLFLYGGAATVYRLFIVASIALLVAAVVPSLGIAIAVWVLVVQVAWPLLRGLRYVVSSPALGPQRPRAIGVTTVALVAVIFVLAGVPVPLSTHAEGIVWLPERAQVRAGAEGRVVALTGAPGERVEAGAALLHIENPLLDGRIEALRWELREEQGRRSVARVEDRVQVQVLEERIVRLEADLAELLKEANALSVSAPVTGTMIVPDVRSLEGRYVRKGDVVAYILEDASPLVRVALPQADAGLLRRSIRRIAVRLVEAPAEEIDARIRLEVPAATRMLPSAALGALGGGDIAVDPGDTEGLRAMEHLFVLDLALPGQAPPGRIGGRALVRFEHQPEPVGRRLYRALRQLLLTRLAV